MVRGECRQQEAVPAQLHCPSSVAGSVQGSAASGDRFAPAAIGPWLPASEDDEPEVCAQYLLRNEVSSIRGRTVKRASLKNFPYRDARKVTLQGGEDAFLSHRRRPPIAAHPKNCRKGKLDGDDVGRGEKQGAPQQKVSNIPAVASGGTSAVATATPTSATPTRD